MNGAPGPACMGSWGHQEPYWRSVSIFQDRIFGFKVRLSIIICLIFVQTLAYEGGKAASNVKCIVGYTRKKIIGLMKMHPKVN